MRETKMHYFIISNMKITPRLLSGYDIDLTMEIKNYEYSYR